MGVWTGICLKLFLGVNITVKGLENIPKDQKYFVVCSHQSIFETFYLQTIFNSSVFILKKELMKIPLFGLPGNPVSAGVCSLIFLRASINKILGVNEFFPNLHVGILNGELKKNDQLISKIRILEGKKIIFTNATSKHAKKILKILELEDDFDQIIDIKDLEYIPKPDKRSYKKLLECLNLNKENLNKTIFFEDTVKNLIPAKELGITTVWMKNSINEKDFKKNFSFIDYSFNNLSEFLDTIKMRG